MALALRPRAILKMSGTVFQDTDPPADKWSYVSIYYTLNNKMKLACGFFFSFSETLWSAERSLKNVEKTGQMVITKIHSILYVISKQ